MPYLKIKDEIFKDNLHHLFKRLKSVKLLTRSEIPLKSSTICNCNCIYCFYFSLQRK